MNVRLLHQFKSAAAIIFSVLIFTSFAAAQEKNDDTKLLAKQYIETHQKMLDEAKNPSQQFYLLAYLSPAALSANDKDLAKNYALQLLDVGEKVAKIPGSGAGNHGKATHTANIVLGRIALANGDIANAKEHLLNAGKIVGNPTLKSFGPDMLLAKLLIENGERETVIQYFDLCAKFWEMENGKLAAWKKVVSEGGMPDFRANLGYETDTWRFDK